MDNHYVKGMFTELITPFHADGRVDYETMEGLIDFQVRSGVTNFFVNGLGAECHELTHEEKIRLLGIVRARAGIEATIMACAFEATVAENKKLLDLYRETGACSCYCITAPPYFRHTAQALYDWAGELIDYCDKPCYIYNCVQMGTLFDPDTLERLWRAHPNFRGYKDATVDLVHFLQVMMRIDKDRFDFLGGCDGTDGVAMLLGAVGCVSFMAVSFPREMKAMIDYGLAGDAEQCMEMQYKLLKVRNAVKQAPFNAAYMYAMNFTGSPVVHHSRMPVHQDFVSDEVKAQVKAVVEELELDQNYR